MNKTQREFDNRDKFIELGYNIAYYRKHAGLTQEQRLSASASVASTSARLKRRIWCVRSHWSCCSTSPMCWTSRHTSYCGSGMRNKIICEGCCVSALLTKSRITATYGILEEKQRR